MKYLSSLIAALLLSACPFPDMNFYVGSQKDIAIVNENEEKIYCDTKDIEEYACLHKDDLIKLKRWINNNCKK